MNDSVFAKRKEISLTRITKAVFPDTTNHHDTLFGGTGNDELFISGNGVF